MVFFTCDKCGEALKKNQVERHNYACRYPTYSCIDCNKVFTANSYKDHIKCITENEKYGGKNFVAKENKGELKQTRWIEQVERAINSVRDRRLKNLLQQIQGYSNIPRKESKFINFLQNSIRIRDRDLCLQAWRCIDEEAKKMNVENKAEVSGEKGEPVNAEKNKLPECSRNGRKADECDVSQNRDNSKTEETTTSCEKSFKWKKTIKRVLKNSDDGTMKVKRLRKAVIEMFRADGFTMEDEEVKELFAHKLKSSGIVVEGKIARLS